jgi:YVTN family beta-propeller protein
MTKRVFGFWLLALILAACSSKELSEEKKSAPLVKDWLLVLNKSENRARILDVGNAGGDVVELLVTGVAPHEVALHGPSGIAVITNYGTRENPGSSLTLVDLHERKVTKTIDLGKFRRPHGLQFFEDGKRVAVTAEGNKSLLILNVSTGEIEKVIPTREEISHLVVLSPDERTAYVSNIGSGSVSVVDLEGEERVKTLKLGEGSEGLDVTPDGGELWVANREEDTVTIVDTESLEVVETVDCASFPIRLRFTPDGRYALISNARSGDVAVFSRSDREEVSRIPMELTATEIEGRLLQFELSPVPIGIVFDPLGNRAFVANSNADIVTIIDLNSWQVEGRLEAGEEPDGMAFLRFEVEEIAGVNGNVNAE